ncbi:MAG: hypothetical protein Q7T55_25780, partial [Solirubrobacteraceae bacterium]|nr:hypothetical protein [Solirubrobacteraceae bacterium]
MSHRILVASLLAIAGLVVPSTASAAVERDGNAFFPKNGAELLEAVELSADGPDRGLQARIALEAKTYVIDRTIDLRDLDGDVIRGPEAGGAVITGTAQSGTLLTLEGETNRVEHVVFRAPATTRSYALIELVGRGLLDAAVDVPAPAPNVTGVRTTGPRLFGWNNTILAPVASAAASAPAVRATGSLRIDAPIRGGSTTVDIDQAAANGLDEEIWIRADLTGGPQTSTVLRARTGVALNLILHRATVTATRSGATVVDLQGASAAAGRLRTWLLTSTLVGPADGTGLEVGPGVGSEPSKVDAVGLLSIGSARAIACSPGTGPVSVVAVDAIYREGVLAPSSSCTLSEQRRVTGDPKFADRERGDLAPRWGSVLIDAAPTVRWGEFPLTSYDKPRVLPNYGADTTLPNDIGAAEYQYTEPVFGAESFVALDNR